MSGLKQNVCCVKSSMPGLLIALAILMMYKLHFWNLRSRSAAAGVAGNSAVVCVTVYIQMWENSRTRYFLIQYGVNIRVLAEEMGTCISWRTLTSKQQRPVARIWSSQDDSQIQNSSIPVRYTSHQMTSNKLADISEHKTVNHKNKQIKKQKNWQ